MKNVKKHILTAMACLMAAVLLSGCSAKMESNDMGMMDAPQTSYDGKYSDGIYDTSGDYEYSMGSDSIVRPADKEAVQTTGRKLIKNVNLRLETKEFDAFTAELNARITAFGGYIQSSSVDGGSYYSRNYRRYATVTARIPAEQLDAFVSGVSEIANVTSRSENTNDVTLSYYDMESHVKALRSEYDTLVGILEKCTELKDVISVQSRITEVLYQIESYQSQLNNYDNLVAYSTITMNISEVERETVVDPETMGERIAAGFSETIADISDDLEDFAVDFVINLPYLLIWAAIIAAFVLIVRALVRRHKKKVAAKRAAQMAAYQQAQNPPAK